LLNVCRGLRLTATTTAPVRASMENLPPEASHMRDLAMQLKPPRLRQTAMDN
jgi:hypothetical protein